MRWEILRCPSCGGEMQEDSQVLSCRQCGMTAAIAENTVSFARPVAAPASPRPRFHRKFLNFSKYMVHPLHGRLSPVRWYTHRRVEEYYERCLKDRALAEEFGEHYLPRVLTSATGAALDFGCGRGRIAALLGQLGFEVTGLDAAPHAFWAKLPGARFVVSAGARLPFQDTAFHLVTHFGVLMYLPDPQTHLREIHRILRPGGYLSIQVTNRCCLRHLVARRIGDAEFFRLYSQEELMSLLQHSGFRPERMFTEGFYAPVFPIFTNFLRRVVLPREIDLFDRDSLLVRLTPPRHRGVINAIAARA